MTLVVEGLVFDGDEQAGVGLIERTELIEKFFKINLPVLSIFPFRFASISVIDQVLVLDITQVVNV